MDKGKFKKELTETAAYALRYASDFYEVKGEEDFHKIYSLNSGDFIKKCYEGFKLAQDKIVANLLDIEDAIRIKKTSLTKEKKGKHKKDMHKDPMCLRLEREIGELEIQRSSFQDVAGSIVWTIFLQERTNIKSFIRTGGGSGYLKDRDIDSSMRQQKN